LRQADVHERGSAVVNTMNPDPQITWDEALRRLKAGNARFACGKARLRSVSRADIAGLAEGQHPFATILGCSDSRVPPEWIFDAGLGELFVVRVAGNVLSGDVAGSIQYAVSHLRTPLLVVLGHEGCGAVEAALATKYDGLQQRSRIQLLVDSILPAVANIDPTLSAADRLAPAVEANVRSTVRTILESPEGQARLHEGRAKIAGAIYGLETGIARFLDI
jgi:carbonic anhydrase